MEFDGIGIWVSDYNSQVLTRFDPVSNEPNGSWCCFRDGEGKPGIGTMIAESTNLWVSVPYGGDDGDESGPSVHKVDVVTNQTTAIVPVGASPAAFDGSSIWARTSDGLVKIDAATNAVTSTGIEGGGWSEQLLFDGTDMWVTNYSLGTVSKIIPF